MATGNVIHIYKIGDIDTTTDNKYTLNTNNTNENISKILYIDGKVVRIIGYQNGKFKTKTGVIVNYSIPNWNDTTLDNTNTSYIQLYENIDTNTQQNLFSKPTVTMTHIYSTNNPKDTGGKRRRYRKSRKPSKTRRNKTHRNKRR